MKLAARDDAGIVARAASFFTTEDTKIRTQRARRRVEECRGQKLNSSKVEEFKKKRFNTESAELGRREHRGRKRGRWVAG